MASLAATKNTDSLEMCIPEICHVDTSDICMVFTYFAMLGQEGYHQY